jgi:hypothetical protein
VAEYFKDKKNCIKEARQIAEQVTRERAAVNEISDEEASDSDTSYQPPTSHISQSPDIFEHSEDEESVPEAAAGSDSIYSGASDLDPGMPPPALSPLAVEKETRGRSSSREETNSKSDHRLDTKKRDKNVREPSSSPSFAKRIVKARTAKPKKRSRIMPKIILVEVEIDLKRVAKVLELETRQPLQSSRKIAQKSTAGVLRSHQATTP